MVKLIKTADNQPVTAAIGDGANDVSMIQEADVGLGWYSNFLLSFVPQLPYMLS